jgi:hypothetical protein
VFYNSIDSWRNIRRRGGRGGRGAADMRRRGPMREEGATRRESARERGGDRFEKESNGVERGEAVGDRVREEEGEGGYNVGFLRRAAAGQMGCLAQLMFAKC